MFDGARADEWPRPEVSPSISADGIQVSAQICSRPPTLECWWAANARVLLSCTS